MEDPGFHYPQSMDSAAFTRGMVLGVSIAAPVGPIGLLCIRRSIALGMRAGFASGLGAATADLVYGLIAAYGLTAITQALLGWQDWLRLGGAAFLLWLAVKFWRAPEPEAAAPAAGFAGTFLLTLANPMTILAFLGIFAGANLTGSAPWIAAGVFTGSALWWLTLSSAAGWSRSRLSPRALVWVNRASALLLGGFALQTFAAYMK